MVENIETKQFRLKFPVFKGSLLILQAAVLLVFSSILLPKVLFIAISLVLFLLWAAAFYFEGSCRAADIPVLFLILGTFTWGKAFSLVGITVGNLPLYVTEMALVASLLLLLLEKKSPVKLWQEWQSPLPGGLAVIFTVYFLLGILYLGIGISGNGTAALRDIVFCFYLFFVFITISLLGNPNRIKSLMQVMIFPVIFLLATAFIIFFIYLPVSPFKSFTRDIKMTNLGLYCGLIVMFGMSFYGYVKRALKWLLGIMVYLGFLFVVMSEVRAAWAGLLVSLILSGILLKKEFKIFILIFALVVISFLVIDYFDLGVQKNKLDSMAEQLQSMTHRWHQVTMPSANIKWRLDIWKQTLAEIKKNPVFGWGYGIQIDYLIWTKRLSWLKAIGSDTGVLPAHNHILAIAYKMGLLGLALFLFINFRVFFYGLGYIKKCKSEFNRRFLIAGLVGLVYWHGMAFFFDVLESPPTGIFLWILLGCILGVVYADKNAG